MEFFTDGSNGKATSQLDAITIKYINQKRIGWMDGGDKDRDDNGMDGRRLNCCCKKKVHAGMPLYPLGMTPMRGTCLRSGWV